MAAGALYPGGFHGFKDHYLMITNLPDKNGCALVARN